jgi:hypothetical protein
MSTRTPRPVEPIRALIIQAYDLPAWQRTEKEARLVALCELAQQKARTPARRKRRP